MKKSLIAIIAVCVVAFVGMIIAAQIFVIGWVNKTQQNMQKSYTSTVSSMMQFAQQQSDKAREAYESRFSSNLND